MTDTWSNDLDAMGRPRKIDFDGPTSMSLGNYSYDGAGNIKSIGSNLFAYDLVSRLTEADLQPLGKSQSYSFDSYGNLTSIVTTSGGVPESRPIGVSAATNRLTGAAYDASGNVTNLFTLSSLTYDPFNRVTHLTGTGVNRSFLYDTNDNRVAILDHQAQTEQWHLRGLHDKVVRSFELGPEGWSWKKDWVFRDGQLVGSSAPAQWREYHLDHLGSPRLVTGPIGLRVAEYHPFPFGEMASANEPGLAGKERRLFRYTGHERDENCETGSCAPEAQDDLDYMMARMYSPRVGRFLGVDPIRPYVPLSLQWWNKYLYALGSPLKYEDPDGLAPQKVKKFKIAYQRMKHVTRDHIRKTNDEKSQFKPNDPQRVQKLIDKTVHSPDKVARHEDGRMLYQRTFNKDIGNEGERVVRVVTQPEKKGFVEKLITAFPAETIKEIISWTGIGTLLGLSEDLPAVAEEFGNGVEELPFAQVARERLTDREMTIQRIETIDY